MERIVGERMRLASRSRRPYLKKFPDAVYDVPLLSSLRQLLSDRFIIEEVSHINCVYFSIFC